MEGKNIRGGLLNYANIVQATWWFPIFRDIYMKLRNVTAMNIIQTAFASRNGQRNG